MRLYLVRHAQTEWNALGKAQGHSDIPLDDEGRRQAEALGAAFSNLRLDRVVSSDLCRAVETAESVAGGNFKLVLNADLRERDLGAWEGWDFTRLGRRIEEESRAQGVPAHSVRPPGGESIDDVWRRIEPFVEELKLSSGATAVVTHGAMCSVILAQLLGGTVALHRCFRFGNTSITELERRAEGAMLIVRYNDVSHLERVAVSR